MILQTNQNTPVSAPQFSDMNAALAVYRLFAGNSVLQMSDFLIFITSPSPERDSFLELFTVGYQNMNNLYIKKTYN